VIAAMIVLGTTACGNSEASGGGGAVISTETFVEVMVALRTSPLLGPAGYLPVGAPERILSEHGVSPEDMRRFVEVHGSDVPFMAEVWSAVDDGVTEARRATSPES
jgi:hypothetical protein